MPFLRARKWVRTLDLRSAAQYQRYQAGHPAGDHPLPPHPDEAYRAVGWAGWRDFLHPKTPDRSLAGALQALRAKERTVSMVAAMVPRSKAALLLRRPVCKSRSQRPRARPRRAELRADLSRRRGDR